MIKSRVGAFRMHYTVPPGLYAVGEPTPESDVFVTANYKLSFDILRRELKEMDAWVLVLDTKSINVWCAAGKGTFGTNELVQRISAAKLDKVVSHRRLILPQLGAVVFRSPSVRCAPATSPPTSRPDIKRRRKCAPLSSRSSTGLS
jgi:acetyl-CoA decarbonylase/synthase complex subunit gamma